MLTGAQIRAARAMVRWSAEHLAKVAKVGVMTVRRAESTDRTPTLLANNLDAIRRALEAAGVEFTNGDEPGVKLKRRGELDRGLRPNQLTSENVD